MHLYHLPSTDMLAGCRGKERVAKLRNGNDTDREASHEQLVDSGCMAMVRPDTGGPSDRDLKGLHAIRVCHLLKPRQLGLPAHTL